MIFRILVGLLIITSSAVHSATIKQHADFTNKKIDIKKIAILPADINLMYSHSNGDFTPNEAETSQVLEVYVEKFQKTLLKRGYKSEPFDLENAKVKEEDIENKINQFKKLYREKSLEISRAGNSKKQEKQTKYSVDYDLSSFANHTDADVLLITTMNGFRKTKGKKRKDMGEALILSAATFGLGVGWSPSAKKGSEVELALVDISTGKILWSHKEKFEATTFYIAVEMPLRELQKR